jgi:hypothetical protein
MSEFLITTRCPTCSKTETNTFAGGFVGERLVEIECLACSRPWLRWPCNACGGMNYEQVEKYPVSSTIGGTCVECGVRSDSAGWGAVSAECARLARLGTNWLDARAEAYGDKSGCSER